MRVLFWVIFIIFEYLREFSLLLFKVYLMFTASLQFIVEFYENILRYSDRSSTILSTVRKSLKFINAGNWLVIYNKKLRNWL